METGERESRRGVLTGVLLTLSALAVLTLLVSGVAWVFYEFIAVPAAETPDEITDATRALSGIRDLVTYAAVAVASVAAALFAVTFARRSRPRRHA